MVERVSTWAGGGHRITGSAHHDPGKLEVVLEDQKFRHAPVDVLAGEEYAQLPDYEGALCGGWHSSRSSERGSP